MNSHSIESTLVDSICDYLKHSNSKRIVVMEEPKEVEVIRSGTMMELTGSDRIKTRKTVNLLFLTLENLKKKLKIK